MLTGSFPDGLTSNTSKMHQSRLRKLMQQEVRKQVEQQKQPLVIVLNPKKAA